MLALTIREKNGDERQLIIDQEDVTIGRAAGSDIVLPRSNISKRHARLVDKHDKVVIVDLRSTNGTYVNGRRITAPELLTFDDKVYIGDFVIRLTRPAEQHASQRMAGPYTAGPPAGGSTLEPRGARLPTQAADVGPAARFADAEPPPPSVGTDAFEAPPMSPPPMDPPDDDEATRALDLAMIAEIDARFAARSAPPPPPEPAYAPPPPPVAAPVDASKPVRPTIEFSGPPPAPKVPLPTARPPREADPDLVATQAIAIITEAQVLKAKQTATEARQPAAPEPRADQETEENAQQPDASESYEAEAPAPWEEVDASSEDDAWAAWNMAIGLLVQRVEANGIDDRSAEEAQLLLNAILESAIANGEISPDIDRDALTEDALGELVSIGPLGEVESDATVSLIYLNGPRAIFLSRHDGAIESTGRVFATSRSYRRALRILTAGTGIVVGDGDNTAAGLQEGRLRDGSLLRLVEPGGGADPVAVWRRGRTDSPTLASLEAAGVMDAGQRDAIAEAADRGDRILVCGAPGEAREAVATAIAAAYGIERRVVRVGDGSGHALPHFNAVTLFAGALVGAAEISALEPELVLFEPLDGRLVHDWVATSLVVGCPILAVTAEADVSRALRRLALAVELGAGVNAGLGERLVREAVGFTVSLLRDAHGESRVHRVAAVSPA